jgi:Zinc finger, C2H2 type
MQFNTMTTNSSWQKEFYYNPFLQELVDINDKSTNNDLQLLQTQNFDIHNLQSNLLSENLKIITSLSNNNDKTNYYNLLNLLSQNLMIYNDLSNILFQNAIIFEILISSNNNERIFHKEHKTQFKCLDCNQSFEEAEQLNAHKIIHSDKKLFQCSLCYHKFYKQKTLDYHKAIHQQQKTFQCNICFRNFRNQNILEIHQKKHSQQRSFACSFCNKKFKTQQVLKIHQSSHSKQAHFLCTYPGCEKKYKSRSSLCKHKTLEHISEKDKKFTCLICSKKFALKSLATGHIKWSHYIKETDNINHAISYTE